MSYFSLEPVATYGGVVEQKTVIVSGSTTNQADLAVTGMDLTLYDVHIFEEVSPGSWTPVGSTVGLEG